MNKMNYALHNQTGAELSVDDVLLPIRNPGDAPSMWIWQEDIFTDARLRHSYNAGRIDIGFPGSHSYQLYRTTTATNESFEKEENEEEDKRLNLPAFLAEIKDKKVTPILISLPPVVFAILHHLLLPCMAGQTCLLLVNFAVTDGHCWFREWWLRQLIQPTCKGHTYTRLELPQILYSVMKRLMYAWYLLAGLYLPLAISHMHLILDYEMQKTDVQDLKDLDNLNETNTYLDRQAEEISGNNGTNRIDFHKSEEGSTSFQQGNANALFFKDNKLDKISFEELEEEGNDNDKVYDDDDVDGGGGGSVVSTYTSVDISDVLDHPVYDHYRSPRPCQIMTVFMLVLTITLCFYHVFIILYDLPLYFVRPYWEDKIKTWMLVTMSGYYQINQTSSEFLRDRIQLDSIFETLKCCGADGVEDWNEPSIIRMPSQIEIKIQSKIELHNIPFACCQWYKVDKNSSNDVVFEPCDHVTVPYSGVNRDGCVTPLVDIIVGSWLASHLCLLLLIITLFIPQIMLYAAAFQPVNCMRQLRAMKVKFKRHSHVYETFTSTLSRRITGMSMVVTGLIGNLRNHENESD